MLIQSYCNKSSLATMQYRCPSSSTSTSSVTVTSDEGKNDGQKELQKCTDHTSKRSAREDISNVTAKTGLPSKWFKEQFLIKAEEDATFQASVLTLLKHRDEAIKKLTDAYIANMTKLMNKND